MTTFQCQRSFSPRSVILAFVYISLNQHVYLQMMLKLNKQERVGQHLLIERKKVRNRVISRNLNMGGYRKMLGAVNFNLH